MARDGQHLTRVARRFPEDEIIVTKTDPRGRIIYANEVFIDVSGYGERELLGQQHSMIRHPEMPRCIFKLLWETIAAGKEIFAYVNNRCKNGDNYWVLAHVTPTYSGGNISGYHSNRRSPKQSAIDAVVPLYERLFRAEQGAADRKAGLASSGTMLDDLLAKRGMSYDAFVLSL